MNKNLKEALRSPLVQRLLFERDALLAPSATRMLIVSDGDAYCSEEQLEPFHANRGALRDKLNVIFHHRQLRHVLADPASALRDADVIGLKLSFRMAKNDALHIARTIVAHRGHAKLIYFDGDDDSVVQWPELLAMADLYVKKHVFRERADYKRRFVGRNNLTDYVAARYGYDFASDPIPASAPLDMRYLDRLHLGYNVALDQRIVALYGRTRGSWSNPHRPIDISCRASLNGWLAPMRGGVAPALAELSGTYRIITPVSTPVDQATYDRELSQSKICICPFGYGEICWRDFEAVLWGSLMVKPRMDAISTRPDIFVPFETYVPVEWDLSDLSEQCRYYLEHPEERERIVRQAYETLSAFYEQGVFVSEVAQMLRRAHIFGSEELGAREASPSPSFTAAFDLAARESQAPG